MAWAGAAHGFRSAGPTNVAAVRTVGTERSHRSRLGPHDGTTLVGGGKTVPCRQSPAAQVEPPGRSDTRLRRNSGALLKGIHTFQSQCKNLHTTCSHRLARSARGCSILLPCAAVRNDVSADPDSGSRIAPLPILSAHPRGGPNSKGRRPDRRPLPRTRAT
jgi:hypothetical protein